MSDLPGYLSSGVFDPRSPPGNLGAIIIGDQFPTRIVDPLPVNRIGFNDKDDNTFFSGGFGGPGSVVGGFNDVDDFVLSLPTEKVFL
nr:hypothetical protein BaRGS_003577 [Batillaria attramentaria]